LAQAESPKEDDFFKIMKVPAPEGTILEVGGLCTLPNGTLAVTTRRGDIFMVENPTGQHPYFANSRRACTRFWARPGKMALYT
jgi:hypothetical protein